MQVMSCHASRDSAIERETMRFDDSSGQGAQSIAQSEIYVSVTVEIVLVLLSGLVSTVIVKTSGRMMRPHPR